VTVLQSKEIFQFWHLEMTSHGNHCIEHDLLQCRDITIPNFKFLAYGNLKILLRAY